MKKILFVLLFSSIGFFVTAQQTGTAPAAKTAEPVKSGTAAPAGIKSNPIPPGVNTVQGKDSLQPKTETVKPPASNNKFRTLNEELITILLLIFGAMVLGIAALIIHKHGTDINYLFKYYIIILVIVGSIILLSVGYDKDQITPAIGLFGTIAGYLLGKSDVNKTTANNANPPAPTKEEKPNA